MGDVRVVKLSAANSSYTNSRPGIISVTLNFLNYPSTKRTKAANCRFMYILSNDSHKSLTGGMGYQSLTVPVVRTARD